MNGQDDPIARLRENPTSVTIFVVLGLGFLTMFVGASWFWMIWVFGYGVIVPLVALASGEEPGFDGEWLRNEDEELETPKADLTAAEDPLETLRGRYARGELTDEEFERKLERLLETETVEAVEDHERERVRERS